MALVACLECKKEIGSTVKDCPHCGTNQKQIKKNKGEGFFNSVSWWGFFFGPVYYAGYGKLTKGIIMQIICFIPLFGLFVAVHCGNNAKKQLPIGEVPFNWGKAAVVIVIIFIEAFIWGSIQEAKEQQNQQSVIQMQYSVKS